MARARAFSYVRFSSGEQRHNDSVRRQTELASEYAKRHGLELDTKLTFHDLGVSAFRGRTVRTGALGAFLKAVDDGLVPKGSFLLVENLDRVSRQNPWDAMPVFQQIINAGVVVVTLQSAKVYEAEELRRNPFLILQSLFEMITAAHENEKKSDRAKAVWANKRGRAASGHILTSNCPTWLELHNGKFLVLPERAKVLRRIFAWAAEGHGEASIARKLNVAGIPPFSDGKHSRHKSDGWHGAYIGKLLANEAVLGRFQPKRYSYPDGKLVREADGEVVEDYYPAVIKPEVFYRVRKFKGKSGYGDRTVQNLLTGMACCYRCGGVLRYVNDGKGSLMLACDTRRRKRACDAPTVRYKVAVAAVLSCLTDQQLDLPALLGHGHDDRRQTIRLQVDDVEARIALCEQQIANLLDLAQGKPTDRIRQRLAEREAALTEAHGSKARLTGELHAATNGHDPLADVTAVIDEWRKRPNRDDLPLRINAVLKRLIAEVRIGHSDEAAKQLRKHWKRSKPAMVPELLDSATLSIKVTFREAGRAFVIAADPKRADRFAAAAMVAGEVQPYRIRPRVRLKPVEGADPRPNYELVVAVNRLVA